MPSINKSHSPSRHRRAGRVLRVGFLLTLAVFATDALAATPIKVFLMGGQSNMRGRASISGLPAELLAAQEDILICRGSQGTVGDQLEFLAPNSPHLGDGGSFGPDLTFGRTIADNFPAADFALLKYAVGGTSLSGSWAVGTGPVYLDFRQTVTNGLALLEAAGYEPEIVGMLWHQGESSIGSTQQQYESSLNAFIADMRTHYGANMPFMIGEIAQIADGAENIVAAQQAVDTADPYAVFVPASDLSFFDQFHFDRPGLVTLGERFANYYGAHFEVLINGPGSETTLPTLTTTDPVNGGTIEVFSNLEATFSEFIVPTGTGSITLKNLDDASGASDLVIQLPDPQVSDNGTQLVIDPETNLAANTNYAVRISSDALEDLAENPFAGILTDEVWFFSTAAPIDPALVVYEPFNDNDSTLPGNTPGMGLTGTWAGDNRATTVTGLAYGSLSTSGNGVQATNGWTNNQVGITASPEYAELLPDGGAMWFSIVFSANVNSDNNVYNRFTFGIGSSSFGANGDLSSGQAIGFGNSGGKLYAGLWETTNWGPDNLQGQPPTTAVNDNFGSLATDTPTLIVGYVQWGADASSPDVVTLYMPGEDLAIGSAVASSSGIVDQSTFDQLMTHNGNVVASQFDEIRIGATYADVVPSSGITFVSWQSANGTTGAFGDDHDGDGVTNGIEFFLFGANNSTGTNLMPGVANSGSTVSVTWPKAADYPGSYGTDYLVEISNTLQSDSWTPADPAQLSGETTYSFPSLSSKEFVRLKVIGP